MFSITHLVNTDKNTEIKCKWKPPLSSKCASVSNSPWSVVFLEAEISLPTGPTSLGSPLRKADLGIPSSGF